MAKFIGTIEEFNKYLGGYTRNTVQNSTRQYKKKIGKCEHCGSRTKNLEAAHLEGKERPVIIANILQNYREDEIINIDLDSFEDQFLSCHSPIENTIKVLCKKCHNDYDKQVNKGDKKISETKQIEIFMNKLKLSKKETIKLLSEKGYKMLDDSNAIFSNINKTKAVYWLEPHNDKFEGLFYIILNDSIKNILHLFEIPKGQIKKPKDLFEQRSDRNYSKIIIDYSDINFKDKSGYDFKKHLKDTIPYNG